MFNWLKRLFGFGKPALDPEIYGGAGGRVPYPPYELVQERRRHRTGLFDTHPTPRKSDGPANQRIRAGGYVPTPAAPVPVREDSIISDLALLALLTSRREPDLNRPSAWPPLDEIKSGGGGDFGGGGASGGWEAPAPSPAPSESCSRSSYEAPAPSPSPDYGSSDSGSSDSSSSSSD